MISKVEDLIDLEDMKRNLEDDRIDLEVVMIDLEDEGTSYVKYVNELVLPLEQLLA